MRSVLKQILLYLCLFLGVATLKAQHVEYGVALDTNYMMIGDQQHLTFKAKVDPGVRIVTGYGCPWIGDYLRSCTGFCKRKGWKMAFGGKICRHCFRYRSICCASSAHYDRKSGI